MSFTEKGIWVYGVVAVVTYAVYLSIILGRAGALP